MTNRPLAERLATVVAAYDHLGWHRSGTAVERATAHWLAETVGEAGVLPVIESYAFERLDPVEAYLEVGDERIEGLPQFDSGLTGEPVEGVLGLDSESDVVVAVVRAGSGSGGMRVQHPSDGAKAVVAITEGDLPGLAPKNAQHFGSPSGPPILQVSSLEKGRVLAWASARRPCSLIARVSRQPAHGYNVVLELEGRKPSLTPVVVMTPLTGWWHCAAERGGGIACWVEAAKRAVASRPLRPMVFVASGGHELGDHGLTRFLESRPYLQAGSHAWLRLGANIGAARPGGIVLASSDPELLDLALAAVRGLTPRPPTTIRGQARFRQLWIRGENVYFHLPEDRWPAAVNLDLLAGQAEAYVDLALGLANSSGFLETPAGGGYAI